MIRRKLSIGIQNLREIRTNNHYADKYRARGEPIYLIGVEFSRAERNIVGFDVEAADDVI
ncbi:MAG: hypothetical protein EPN21_10720 [Methylococcaceae bacterium]|nr:MAG: hypothetical protein EPN21_10720 [Methylococcaceae bacterium]